MELNSRQQEILDILYETGKISVAVLAKRLYVAEMTVRRDLSAMEKGGFLRRQVVICGSKGTIEIKPLEVAARGGQYTVMNEVYHEDWHTAGNVTQSQIYDRYDSMMKNFAEIVRKEKENPYSYDYERNLYKMVLKACGKDVVLCRQNK